MVLEILMISTIVGFGSYIGAKIKPVHESNPEEIRHNTRVTYVLQALIVMAVMALTLNVLRGLGIIHIVGFHDIDLTSETPSGMIDQICKGREHD